jgi:PAS domain S-box-containing protein
MQVSLDRFDRGVQSILRFLVLVLALSGAFLHVAAYAADSSDSANAGTLVSDVRQDDPLTEDGEIDQQQDPITEDALLQTEAVSDTVDQEILSPSGYEMADSTSAAIPSSAVGKKFPFYRRWWFSFLIILLALPLAYRYLKNREKEWKRIADEHSYRQSEFKRELAEKDEQLARQESEFHARLVEEEELKFHAVGLSRFSEIMSHSKDELKKVGQQLMSELVRYLGVNMAALYTVKGEDESSMVLEFLSGYAPEAKQMEAVIHPGEGYVGTCFNEGTVMDITDVPETYTKISSGLGEALPRYLVFLPLMQDESRLGVIELASFKKLEKYKLDFVQKLSQNIANFIAIRTATARMQEMLEQSKSQSEELQAQEEELRQNLEEMQATQEELSRQIEKNKLIQHDLAKEKYLMDALMNSLPEFIYFKDLDSKFLKNSRSHSIQFGFSDPKDIVGKSDFDFFSDEHARPAFEAEQNIIKTGKPIIDRVEKKVKKDGSVSWVSTTKMPLVDNQGKIVGTFGISKDITKAREAEIEIQQKNEELKAQEEELRQTIEEMQSVHEELERQKAELDWEKHLMDTLLNNLPEYIYFKDKDSKFLKNSLSHARLFGYSDPKEIIGKSDFDFFSDEHARPAFKDEQGIIKTGKSILNLVEKEVKKDGTTTWVSTSKMPLYDKQGNIIGTFGISKDITETKKMEMEINQRNRELQAQEEELKQHLEEMKTIQDDLQRRIKENEKIKSQFQKREKELLKKIEELKKK